jgi:hypothetical protein
VSHLRNEAGAAAEEVGVQRRRKMLQQKGCSTPAGVRWIRRCSSSSSKSGPNRAATLWASWRRTGRPLHLSGTIGGECGHDDVPPFSHRPRREACVGLLIGWLGEKMQGGAVVPQIHLGQYGILRHVGDDPVRVSRPRPEPRPRTFESYPRQVQEDGSRIAGIEQLIDELRCAGPDVDHPSRGAAESADELHRALGPRLVPAHLPRLLALVHSIPVCGVHADQNGPYSRAMHAGHAPQTHPDGFLLA